MMRRRRFNAAWAGGLGLALAGCGGGGAAADGGAGASGNGSTGATITPTAPGSTGSTTSSAVSFGEVSVHDPSVLRVGSRWWVFGSHLAAAWSDDLMHWTMWADGVGNANPLFNQVLGALADTFAWSQVQDLWAPDVAPLPDGRFAFYYNSCKGDSPRSALGLAVADSVGGPYVNRQILLKSGMWGLPSEDGTVYDAGVHPNTVDPQVLRDASGAWWLLYGSYSGGLFMLALDAATGLPRPGQGYGKHLVGGHHARIEGGYVLYSPLTQYYYLFMSFGGLDANGGYNLRVARSRQPDGPYVDGAGTDMATVQANPALPLFDDASIAPHGQKLMGNHQFSLLPGQTGSAPGYVSPGHNSAAIEPGTGTHLLFFHTRFPGRGEQHELRVHAFHFNALGWPVVAPLRHVPPGADGSPTPATVDAADAVGSYQLVNHGKAISAAIVPAVALRLLADGTLAGDGGLAGRWTHDGGNRVTLTLGAEVYSGVLSRQWHANAGAFVVCVSAQSAGGVSLWAIRCGA